MKQILIIIGVLIMLTSCSNQKKIEDQNEVTESVEVNEHDVSKIYVDENGEITSNGDAISLEDLDKELTDLKEKNGVVYYSRSDARNDPPEASMKVIQLVVKHGLPIKFYTDKTFKTPAEM